MLTRACSHAPSCDHAAEQKISETLGSELCGSQEVEVPRRVELDMSYAAAVHHHIVEVPQIDIRHVVGQNALYLGIERLPQLRIDLPPGLIDQRIHVRV